METDAIEQQADLEQRKIRHQKEKADLRNPDNSRVTWKKFNGHYQVPLLDTEQDELHFQVEGLSEIESFSFLYLQQVLRQRRLTGDQSPVLMADFGGGWINLSLLKIISKLEPSLVMTTKLFSSAPPSKSNQAKQS